MSRRTKVWSSSFRLFLTLVELQLSLDQLELGMRETNAPLNKVDIIASVLSRNQSLRKIVVKVPPSFFYFVFFYS